MNTHLALVHGSRSSGCHTMQTIFVIRCFLWKEETNYTEWREGEEPVLGQSSLEESEVVSHRYDLCLPGSIFRLNSHVQVLARAYDTGRIKQSSQHVRRKLVAWSLPHRISLNLWVSTRWILPSMCTPNLCWNLPTVITCCVSYWSRLNRLSQRRIRDSSTILSERGWWCFSNSSLLHVSHILAINNTQKPQHWPLLGSHAAQRLEIPMMTWTPSQC